MTHDSAKFALDATVADIDRGGTGVYTRRLVPALRSILGERLALLRWGVGGPLGNRRTAADRASNLIRDVWWTQHGVVRAARREGASLIHLPANVGPVASKIPVVVTIHDLMPFRRPEFPTPCLRRPHYRPGQPHVPHLD